MHSTDAPGAADDAILPKLWSDTGKVRDDFLRELKTKKGTRTAKVALLSMIQMGLRVAIMLLVAALIHLMLRQLGWYNDIGQGEVIAASVVQGLFALVGLFGAYFLFNRAQSVPSIE